MEVNTHWMCDEGRLSYRRIEAEPRLSHAASPYGQKSGYEAAVSRAAQAVRTAAEGGRLAALVSPRMTSESIFAWRELFAAVGGAAVGVVRLEAGEDDELLIRRDKGANSTGAGQILPGASTADTVLEAIRGGGIDTLVVFGDVLDPADTIQVPAEIRSKLTELIYVGPFEDETAKQATVVLPAGAWAEEDGTMVNFEGRVQRVRRAHVPRAERRPAWRIAADVARSAAVELPAWASSADVLASLAGSVGSYHGLDEQTIGLLGVANETATATGA
jgi:NADH-quinone oxidoreductase subunit G